MHANFIVNNGGATAEELSRRHVRERVREDSGVRLELEVTLMGKLGGRLELNRRVQPWWRMGSGALFGKHEGRICA